MGIEQVLDLCARLHLLGVRWAWAITNSPHQVGRHTPRRSWAASQSSRTASPRRTIGMATVTPEMGQGHAVTAWRIVDLLGAGGVEFQGEIPRRADVWR